MAWVEPIKDRTKSDVDYVKSIISKIKDIGYSGLTVTERNDWESTSLKGVLNMEDINRIEDNISYLSTTLTSYGYNVPIVTHVAWTRDSILYIADIDRIKSNIQSIITGFYNDPTNPVLVSGSRDMNYTIANNIELVLYNLKTLLDGMILSLKMCGTFNCGATIFL